MTNKINYLSCDDDIEYDLRSKYCVYSCNQNPDKVCFIGQCVVINDDYGYNVYRSKKMTNPTYRDIFLLCDKIVVSKQNFEHIFFESVSYSHQINEHLHALDVFLGS